MSRNFLFALLSLTVAGLLWGAHGDSPDGATADNNNSSLKVAATTDGVVAPARPAVSPPGLVRLPYLAMRAAGRVPAGLLRALAWLPRRAAQALRRLAVLFRERATDVLGYLASSEGTEVVRVRRGAPAEASSAAGGSGARGSGGGGGQLLLRLLVYPVGVAARMAHAAMGVLPVAGAASLLSSLTANGGEALMSSPLLAMAGNATREAADYATLLAWNFTKSSVLPQLDVFVNELKETGAVPQSLMGLLIELQTLYHIFKFLGMA